MVDSLKELKAGNIVFAHGLGFKIERITKVTRETIDIVDDGQGPSKAYVAIPIGAKPGTKFKLGNGHTTKYLGTVTYETCHIKGVPPGYEGGRLDKKNFEDRELTRLISGDKEVWAAYNDDPYHYSVDMEYAMVGEGTVVKPLADIKGLVKLDLMAYVISVHGPQIRDEALRMAAALEGKPWVPTSNNQYFQSATRTHKKGCQCTLVGAGKLGRKQLYGLGPVGLERAKKVLKRLGKGPAEAVK